MHVLVHNNSFTVLSNYILADLPGVDWFVRNHEGRNFVQHARWMGQFPARIHKTVVSLCNAWEARWRSVAVPELQRHLPVMSHRQYVLSDLVLSYLIEEPCALAVSESEPEEEEEEEEEEGQQNEEQEVQESEEEDAPAAVMPTDLDDQLIAVLAAQV